MSPKKNIINPTKSVFKLDNKSVLISPRSRNDAMSVTGSKFGVERMSVSSKTPVPNADLSIRSARGPSKNPFSPRSNMTIQEYVKVSTNATEYGHTFYKTPSNEMLMKKIPLGLSSKEKNLTFAEQI